MKTEGWEIKQYKYNELIQSREEKKKMNKHKYMTILKFQLPEARDLFTNPHTVFKYTYM